MVNLDDPTLCTKCGICCYVALPDEKGVLFFTPFYCCKLASKLCSCYQSRFTRIHFCLTVREAVKQRQLPNGCPYVSDRANYKGPNPDYRQSPQVTALVNRINEHGNGVFVWRNLWLKRDYAWTPKTTTYPLAVTCAEGVLDESP